MYWDTIGIISSSLNTEFELLVTTNQIVSKLILKYYHLPFGRDSIVCIYICTYSLYRLFVYLFIIIIYYLFIYLFYITAIKRIINTSPVMTKESYTENLVFANVAKKLYWTSFYRFILNILLYCK